jgi:predicted secreted Zn-dependent protease
VTIYQKALAAGMTVHEERHAAIQRYHISTTYAAGIWEATATYRSVGSVAEVKSQSKSWDTAVDFVVLEMIKLYGGPS